MNDRNKNVRAVEAIYHEAALVAAEHGPSTRETRAAARRLEIFAQERVAAARRAATARVQVAVPERRPIRPSLLAMARDALLARYEQIRVSYPGALVAGVSHHKLSGTLTDDELRTIVEDAELAIEESETPTPAS